MCLYIHFVLLHFVISELLLDSLWKGGIGCEFHTEIGVATGLFFFFSFSFFSQLLSFLYLGLKSCRRCLI